MCKPCQLSPEIAVEMKDMVWRNCAHHAARCGAGYTGPKLLGASNHDRKARA